MAVRVLWLNDFIDAAIRGHGTFTSMHHTDQAFNVQQISANGIIQRTDDLVERVIQQIVVSFEIFSECMIDVTMMIVLSIQKPLLQMDHNHPYYGC